MVKLPAIISAAVGLTAAWALFVHGRTPAPAAEAPAASPPAASASAPAPATGPARPARWYYYCAYGGARLLAATRDHLWFGPLGLFRYDLKTGKAEAVTPMQGVRVDSSSIDRVNPSGDGRFAFTNGWPGMVVWSAAKGLQPVASDSLGGYFEWIGFDTKDRLLLRKKLDTRQAAKWFVYHFDTAGWEAVAAPAAADLRPAIEKQAPAKMTGTAPSGRSTELTITLQDGKVLPMLRTAPYSQRDPYRDVNGHIWFGFWRFDGSAWKRVVPPEFFPFENQAEGGVFLAHAAALDPSRCELDERTMTWRGANPAGDVDIYAYDPAERTGFRQVEKDGKCLLQQVRHTAGGWSVLRELDVTDYRGMPQTRDSKGDWWWPATGRAGQSFVLRLGEKGIKAYRLDWPVAGYGSRQLVVSPKGQLWFWDGAYWQRYDAEADTFIPPGNAPPPTVGDKRVIKSPQILPSDWPLNDFAFQFGKWTLARVGYTGLMAGALFVKRDDAWERFMLPGGDLTGWGGRPGLSGTRGMFHGRRMLVHWEGKDWGIYEYDLDSGRWEYLVDGVDTEAGYDAAGRVIIRTPWGLLVYDRGTAPAADAEPGRDAESAHLVAQLVRQLDAESYDQREQATNKLIAMGKPILPQIREQKSGSRNSPEVQSRLAIVLDKLAPPGSPGPRPVSLLRRMHPVLTTRPAGQ
jgi:hypothetical protein